MKSFRIVGLLLAFFMLGTGLKAQIAPIVTSSDATNITQHEATLNGSVITGSEALTEKGFEWKVNVDAVTNWSSATATVSGNIITLNITGLSNSTDYTSRAYVVTASGEKIYSAEKTFTTLDLRTVLEGGNLDFSQGYSGWVAKEGTYGGNSSSPTWTWNSQYSNNGITTATDTYGRLFEIFSSGTDSRTSNSGNILSKIPYAGTNSSQINNYGGGTNCSQLSYSMQVQNSNCLLTFNYAMVLENPGHDGYENPTFQIDVMQHDPSNPSVMTNNLVDSCAFFEQQSSNSLVTQYPSVWHYGSSSSWVWCNWQQIKISLAKYIGDRITLRIRLGDCQFTAHGAYGYVSAYSEQPSISAAGCAGEGDTVTTAEAPSGFESYKWFEIPAYTTSQSQLESYEPTGNGLSTSQVFAITENIMNNTPTKYFAVKLVSPRTQTSRPHCIAYIPLTVNDTRPNFDNITYIPVNPESQEDEVGFYWPDVQPVSNAYPLGWQAISFGDGDSVSFYIDESNKWQAEQLTLNASTTRIVRNAATDDIDTIYHIYEPGRYIVRRWAQTQPQDGVGTCMKNDTINVTVYERPALQITGDDTICYGAKDTLVASSPGNTSTANYRYDWWYSGQDTTEAAIYTGTTCILSNVTSDTTIKVRVKDTEQGFYRWGYFKINVQAFPDITLEGDTMLCIGQQASITAYDATGNTVAMQWTFTEPTGTPVITNPSTNPSLTFTPTKDTTVYLLAETSQGCLAWKSINIYMTIPEVSSDVSRICPGQSATLTGGHAVDYSWSALPPDASLTEDVRSTEPVTVSPEETTVYTMKGYGTSGCYAEKTITITVIPYPVPRISYTPEYVDMDDPQLSITDASDYGYYTSWTFSDGGRSDSRTVNHTFLDLSVDSVGIHMVSYNELGCSDSTDVKVPIELFAVWVPNAFTPNGDGSNDYFFPITVNHLTDFSFEVFNRWGAKLYSFTSADLDASTIEGMSKQFGWDGKYKDEYVKNGAYVWRLQYKREGSTRVFDRTGTVNVVR